MRIVDNNSIEYGYFLVTKMQEVDYCFGFQTYSNRNPQTFGVFRIDLRKTGFIDNQSRPIDTHKIRLTPVGRENYLERDWYTCDIFCARDTIVYDNFDEANEFANYLNAFTSSIKKNKKK